MGLASTARRPRPTAAGEKAGQRRSAARSAAWTSSLSSTASMPGALAVLDLELLQVADALVGVGDAAQELVRVDQHQAGPVDGEQVVGAADDPAQGVVEVPGGVAQVAELVQRPADLVGGHGHRADHLPGSRLPTRSVAPGHMLLEAWPDAEPGELLPVRLGLLLGLELAAVDRPVGTEH